MFIMNILLLTLNLHTAPFEKESVKLVQPDKTTIIAFSSGDEYHSWIHDKDDYTIIKDEKTQYFCWAKLDQKGELTSTGYPVHQHDPTALGIFPGVNISNDKYLQKMEEWQQEFNSGPERTPRQGNINNIVIFIKFAGDQPFDESVPNTPYPSYSCVFNDTISTNNTQFDSLGNKVHGIYSFREHIRDSSHGKLEIISHFRNSITNQKFEYTAPEQFAFYNVNDWGIIRSLLIDAIQYVNTHVGIPNQINLDTDSDGFVDHITFISRSHWVPGPRPSEVIPAHMSNLRDFNIFINNKKVGIYNYI
jgi:hypothetical protein